MSSFIKVSFIQLLCPKDTLFKTYPSYVMVLDGRLHQSLGCAPLLCLFRHMLL